MEYECKQQKIFDLETQGQDQVYSSNGVESICDSQDQIFFSTLYNLFKLLKNCLEKKKIKFLREEIQW